MGNVLTVLVDALPKKERGKTVPKKKSGKKKKKRQKGQQQQQHRHPPGMVDEDDDDDDDDVPLTWHEQELLHETIPNLTPDHLNGVIDIIREAATPPGGGDIDVELDQLEMVTQRKLFRYV